MAAGRLAAVDITSLNTNTEIYAVPTGKTSTFSINMCNRNATDVAVHLAFTSGGVPADTDWIKFDDTIYANDAYKELGVVLGEGEKVYAKSDTANVNVVCWGFEEDNS